MVTTPVAILSRVCAQLAGVLGMPGAGTGTGRRVPFTASGTAAPTACVRDSAKTDKSIEIRDMPILGVKFRLVPEVGQDQEPDGSQARSSCFAARTSSNRRTGIVCGAEARFSG